MRKLILFIVLSQLLSFYVLAQDEIVVEPGKKCPMIGMSKNGDPPDQPHQQQNKLKNRYNLPKSSDINPDITLEKILKPGDDHNRFSQDQAVEITGYVMDVKSGGKEGCNCNTSNSTIYDTHISIALDKNDTDPTHWMVAEVTPRIRNYMNINFGVDWTSQELSKPNKLIGEEVKFQGWLLFDNDHISQARNTHPDDPHHNNWRATCWEIHPITQIEVVSEGEPLALTTPGGNISQPQFLSANLTPSIKTEPMGTNTPVNVLAVLLIGALLGMAGQGARIIVGLKKVNDDAHQNEKTFNDVFVGKQLLLSLIYAMVIGGITGIILGVDLVEKDVSTKALLGIMAAGYAGTDFIEGFVNKTLKK